MRQIRMRPYLTSDHPIQNPGVGKPLVIVGTTVIFVGILFAYRIRLRNPL